jgi:hypothetical protein
MLIDTLKQLQKTKKQTNTTSKQQRKGAGPFHTQKKIKKCRKKKPKRDKINKEANITTLNLNETPRPKDSPFVVPDCRNGG